MNESAPYLSVIVTLDPRPGVMAAFYAEFFRFAATVPVGVELVVVNGLGLRHDVAHLAPPAEQATLTTSPRPGQGNAFLHGATLARGQVLLSIDPDMPGNISDIPALLERHRAGMQLVFTRRVVRNDVGHMRRLGSYVFNFCLRLVTRESLHDFNSPMLLVSRPALDALLQLGLPVEAYKLHAYFLHRDQFAQVDIVVARSKRRPSNYSFLALLRLFWVRLRMSLRYRNFAGR